MPPKIGLDPKTFVIVKEDMQGADVRGFGGDNAAPTMVQRKLAGKTAPEVIRLADIYRLPLKGDADALTENVNSGALKVISEDFVDPEFIGCAASPGPSNSGRSD